eukprot:scaffold22808_cov112-Isochrysis_galbana.AAC.3
MRRTTLCIQEPLNTWKWTAVSITRRTSKAGLAMPWTPAAPSLPAKPCTDSLLAVLKHPLPIPCGAWVSWSRCSTPTASACCPACPLAASAGRHAHAQH